MEALVASVVVASAGAMLYGGLFQISRMQQLRARQAVAVRVLANQLAVVEDVVPGVSWSGACEAPHQDLTCALTAQATGSPELARVAVSVAWSTGAGEEGRGRVEVVTFRPVPKPPS